MNDMNAGNFRQADGREIWENVKQQKLVVLCADVASSSYVMYEELNIS